MILHKTAVLFQHSFFNTCSSRQHRKNLCLLKMFLDEALLQNVFSFWNTWNSFAKTGNWSTIVWKYFGGFSANVAVFHKLRTPKGWQLLAGNVIWSFEAEFKQKVFALNKGQTCHQVSVFEKKMLIYPFIPTAVLLAEGNPTGAPSQHQV